MSRNQEDYVTKSTLNNTLTASKNILAHYHFLRYNLKIQHNAEIIGQCMISGNIDFKVDTPVGGVVNTDLSVIKRKQPEIITKHKKLPKSHTKKNDIYDDYFQIFLVARV